jgi:iron complex outermembrane receptor protein
VNLHSTYQLTDNLELFAMVQNLFNTQYATFGQFGDPSGIGTPGVPTGGGVNTRFYTPAAPVALFGGVRLRL